jgi:hypothetical protein
MNIGQALGITQAPRPIPDQSRLPEYRWPSERRRMPDRCGNCGSIALEVDAPGGRFGIGSVDCVMCGHQQCWLREG